MSKLTEESLQGQDAFLGAARAQANHVSIFLGNGVRLVGIVGSFDRHTVILRSATGQQLVYKHVISTIQADTEKPRPVGVANSDNRDIQRPAVVIARNRRVPRTGDVSR